MFVKKLIAVAIGVAVIMAAAMSLEAQQADEAALKVMRGPRSAARSEQEGAREIKQDSLNVRLV